MGVVRLAMGWLVGDVVELGEGSAPEGQLLSFLVERFGVECLACIGAHGGFLELSLVLNIIY